MRSRQAKWCWRYFIRRRMGQPGPENTRSLTLRILHKEHRILLTGDLEGEGLGQVMKTRTPPINVLRRPHHGSKNLDTKRLVEWAGMPWVVVSSQGRPRGNPEAIPEGYHEVRHFLRTWDDGAVTVRSHSTGLVVETFLTQQRLTRPTVAPRKAPRAAGFIPAEKKPPG